MQGKRADNLIKEVLDNCEHEQLRKVLTQNDLDVYIREATYIVNILNVEQKVSLPASEVQSERASIQPKEPNLVHQVAEKLFDAQEQISSKGRNSTVTGTTPEFKQVIPSFKQQEVIRSNVSDFSQCISQQNSKKTRARRRIAASPSPLPKMSKRSAANKY